MASQDDQDGGIPEEEKVQLVFSAMEVLPDNERTKEILEKRRAQADQERAEQEEVSRLTDSFRKRREE